MLFTRSLIYILVRREANDEVESADAYFGLGFGYLKKYMYDDAISYLDISLSKLELLKHTEKLLAVLRALYQCFDRLGQEESAVLYNTRIQQIEGEQNRRFRMGEERLEGYRVRLMGKAAAPEVTVCG